MEQSKIVIDADVLIHFYNAGRLFILPKIFSEHEYLLLSTVYEEISKRYVTKHYLDKFIGFFKNITELKYEPTGKEQMEFYRLKSKKKEKGGLRLGKGESACMVYCRFHKDVLGSSNLKDVKDYCEENGIKYLTTLDFLYYAVKKGLLTEQEWDDFIKTILGKGGKLPPISYSDYKCNVKM